MNVIVLKPSYAWKPNHKPRPIINKPDNKVKLTLGKILPIHLPSNTTPKVDDINAIAEPAKTINGLPDCADSKRVAICVLSPNSARNTLRKVEIRILIKPFEEVCSFSFVFFSILSGTLVI